VNTKIAGGDEVTLASLVESISDRLFFTVISVLLMSSMPIKVFETLNARGIRLSSVDLLKNHLYLCCMTIKDYLLEMKTLEDR
jgi:hypothetical protein